MAAVRIHNNPFLDAPPPPPKPPKPQKSQKSARMSSSRSRPARDPPSDIADAVRDTVAFRPHQDSSRIRPGRSNTAVSPPSNQVSHPITRRSHSQDSGAVARLPKSRPPKKGSRHADVIDRLDFSGVGPMFHHDGPFDACAPSRNRQQNMAPIHSWSPSPEDDLAYNDNGAYPSAHAYGAFSNDYPEIPKKKVDAIAEAWGMHEPEPFEEFLAGGGRGDTPASSIYNGRSGRRSAKDGRDSREPHREKPDEGQTDRALRPRVTTRRTVPPPQPIFVPSPVAVQGDALASTGIPRRSKSLMQRIRNMRDAPNVPVGSDSVTPSPPTSPTEPSRPTHRSQNSFLGRFGHKTSPTHNTGSDKSESYVFIDAHNKQLPATPGQNTFDNHIDTAPALVYGDINVPSGSDLGRKTSIIQKVGRVVRGR
ncbi:hypothetical protein APHAL10511_006431 [Amanita phalloides]|nr:hypothetical protein APHAL10511_006431 [Amanita phalloides]